MTDRAYFTIDKTDWPEGPWQHEPDKIQFVDEATGLPCLIKRNHMGALCGYVGVAPGHPLFGKDGDETDLLVHGGVTYNASCQEGDEATSICHIPEPDEPDHVWWFGFDCAHYNDGFPNGPFAVLNHPSLPEPIYKTVSYVRAECAALAAQLAEEAACQSVS